MSEAKHLQNSIPMARLIWLVTLGIVIDGKCVQTSEFGREQQIRSRPIDQIAKRPAIAPQNRTEVVRIGGEAPHVARKRIIFSEDSIQFELGSELELELTPSSSRVEPANARRRIVWDHRRREQRGRCLRPILPRRGLDRTRRREPGDEGSESANPSYRPRRRRCGPTTSLCRP